MAKDHASRTPLRDRTTSQKYASASMRQSPAAPSVSPITPIPRTPSLTSNNDTITVESPAKRPRIGTSSTAFTNAPTQPRFLNGDCVMYSFTRYQPGTIKYDTLYRVFAKLPYATYPLYWLVPIEKEVTLNQVVFVGMGKQMKKTRHNVGEEVPITIGGMFDTGKRAIVKGLQIRNDRVVYQLELNGHVMDVVGESVVPSV